MGSFCSRPNFAASNGAVVPVRVILTSNQLDEEEDDKSLHPKNAPTSDKVVADEQDADASSVLTGEEEPATRVKSESALSPLNSVDVRAPSASEGGQEPDGQSGEAGTGTGEADGKLAPGTPAERSTAGWLNGDAGMTDTADGNYSQARTHLTSPGVNTPDLLDSQSVSSVMDPIMEASTSFSINQPHTPADSSRTTSSVSTPQKIHVVVPNYDSDKQPWQQLPILSPIDSHLLARPPDSSPWSVKPALQPLGHPSVFQQQPGPAQSRMLKSVKQKQASRPPMVATGIYGRGPPGRPLAPGGPGYRPAGPCPHNRYQHIDAAAAMSAAAVMRGGGCHVAASVGEADRYDSALSSRDGSVLNGAGPPSDSFDLSASLPASRFGSTRESRTFTDQELFDNQPDLLAVASKLKQGLPLSRGSLCSSNSNKPSSSNSHRSGGSNWNRNNSQTGTSIHYPMSAKEQEEEEYMVAFSKENLGPSRFSLLTSVAEDSPSPKKKAPPLTSLVAPLEEDPVAVGGSGSHSRLKSMMLENAGAAGSGTAQVLTLAEDVLAADDDAEDDDEGEDEDEDGDDEDDEDEDEVEDDSPQR